MKKLLLLPFLTLAVLVLIRPINGQESPGASGQITTTNNHTVATNIVSTNLVFTSATFIGLKAGGISNAAAVYVGPTTGAQYYVIYPGERHIIHWSNRRYGLQNWWLRTPTTGDGIHVIYQ